MLNEARLVGFIPVRNADDARHFYEHVLGLGFVSDDSFALVFRMADGTSLRVVRVGEFTPAAFTILGWQVTDIRAQAQALAAAGVAILRYTFLEQDESGIWTAPNGNQVLWFTDPDGNVLSISQT